MGEDSIILPIDRVISEDIVGTRAEKRLYCKVNRSYNNRNKRSLIIKYTPAIVNNNNKSVKFVISVFIGLLVVSCCLLSLIGTREQYRMSRDYGELSDDETSRDDLSTRMELNDDEMDNIRRSIVEGLGLKRIPDPSKANVSQTEYERAHVEYLRRLQLSRGPGDRRRRRLHTFHATDVNVNRTKRSTNQIDSLYFPLGLPADEEVDHATLRLILLPTVGDDEVEVEVYRIADRTPVESRIFSIGDGPRWIELDVTDPVVSWHEEEEDTENLGLELRVLSKSSGDFSKVSWAQPVLNVFSTAGSIRRKRGAPDHLMSLHRGRKTECRGDNKKCCRHEMTVIFKDLKGFEFIIQPKDFDAGYCKGRCPPRYNPAHHHALLQSLIWKEDRRKAPRPCCAPSKLAELEILYFDENDASKLKVSTWKNMRVLECACS